MTVKVGFIGAGGNANWHMDFLKDVPDAEVAAVSDIYVDKAQATAASRGLRAYASYKVMLEKEKLDCCYISIPAFQHGDPEIEVIQRGIPFFVEKPLALTQALMDDISERVAKRGIGTCVGYQVRYLDIMDKAREMLANTFVATAQGHYVCGTIGGWYTRMALSGGQIVEQATHMVDLMRFLLGDVEWVAASKRQGAVVTSDRLDATSLAAGSASNQAAGLNVHEYNIWDATTLLLQFRSGVPATFICSCQANYTFDALLDIITTDFRLKIDFEKMAITRKVDGETREETIEADKTPKIDAAFIQAVKTGDFSAIRSSYADAVESMRVSLAAVQAAQTGAFVRL